MPHITPFLMFNNQLEDAIAFYGKVFTDAKIESHSPNSATFELAGQKFHAYNGGPYFAFSQGVSFMISVTTQDEVDYYYDSLSDGGETQACGWLTDRFGLSWQVTPDILLPLLSDPDREKANRATQAMLTMKKLDIAMLLKAFEG